MNSTAKDQTMKSRKRNNQVEYLYGGYATWSNRRGEIESREIHVWGPPTWDPSCYGDGSEIQDAVEKKARKRWKNAECRECWRC